MTKFILGIGVLLFTWSLKAQTQNFWTKKADFSGLKRERAVSFTIGDKGYIATGVDTTDVTNNDLWEFDAGLNAWTQKANLPASPRRNAIGFSIGNIGYLGTGMDSTDANLGNTLSDFWAYDPISNSWTEKAQFPAFGGSGIYFATAFTIDGKGYICCGKRGPNNYSSQLWEYKVLNNSWIQKSNFPGGVRYQLSSFAIDGRAYIGFGIDQDVYRKDLWQYNPATNGWVEKNDFPGGERGGATTFTIAERGFICLGSDGGLKKDLWEYNPYSDTWSVRGNFGGSARKNAIAFVIGNRAFVGIGKGYSGKKMSFYEYRPYELLNIENEDKNPLIIFPNPTYNVLNITGNNDYTKLMLIDCSGKLVLKKNIDSPILYIDREQIKPGIYFIKLYHSNTNKVYFQKLILT